jgi:hypothetical protein
MGQRIAETEYEEQTMQAELTASTSAGTDASPQ